jgi:hypothetical protein
MSFDLGGVVGPVVGLAVAGYTVKAIGDMVHGECKHCGHKIKAKSHEKLKHMAAIHTQTHKSEYHQWLGGF